MEIVMRLQVEGFHHWPGAAEFSPEVTFLADNHRHIFHIEARKKVQHDERDLEIILTKREIEKHISNTYDRPAQFGPLSCEAIARSLTERFDLSGCSVLEDGENGAIYTPVRRISFIIGKLCSGKSTMCDSLFEKGWDVLSASSIAKRLSGYDTRAGLSTTKDLEEAIAKELVRAIASNRNNVVIDGVRQLGIIKAIEKYFDHIADIDFIYLDVDDQERLRRFNERADVKDDLTLVEGDEKDLGLGLAEVLEYIEIHPKTTRLETTYRQVLTEED